MKPQTIIEGADGNNQTVAKPSALKADPAATSRNNHHITAPEDKVPAKEKFTYSLGICADHLGANFITGLANPIFNVVLGVNPVLIGFSLGLMRLWDAFTDPIMGCISDNCRSRFGRRRPFMLAGAIMMGILFPLIWLVPPEWSPTAIVVYFTACCVAFYTAQTIFTVPYTALGYELTPDYHERTRIMAWRAYSGKMPGLVLPWAFALTQLSFWQGDTMRGVRWVGVGFALLIVATALAPFLFNKERFFQRAVKQEKLSLRRSLSETLQNKPFLQVIGITLLTITGTQLVNHLGFYVSTYYLYGGDMGKAAILSGISGNLQLVVGLLSVFFLNKLSQSVGKRKALGLSIALLVLSGPVKWLCYIPSAPYFSLLDALVTTPAFAGFWLLIASMKADVCDFDELKTGLRREGSFASVSAWFVKIAYSTTAALSGVVLVLVGFSSELKGNQTGDSLFWMRVWFSFIPSATALFALFLVWRFPVSEEKAYEVRQQLEARRGRI